MPPEGRAGHRAGGEELTQGDSFVYLGRAEFGDGKTGRDTSKSTRRSERVASS